MARHIASGMRRYATATTLRANVPRIRGLLRRQLQRQAAEAEVIQSITTTVRSIIGFGMSLMTAGKAGTRPGKSITRVAGDR